MKSIIIFILVLISTSNLALGQNSKNLLSEDFNSIKELKEMNLIKTSGSIGLIKDGCESEDAALLLLGNNASVELQINNSDYGIGKVEFDYKAQNINGSNGFTIKYSYFSNKEKSWKIYNTQKLVSNSSICLPNPIDLEDLSVINISKFKIEVTNFNSGELLIDNLRVSEIPLEKYYSIKASKDFEKEKGEIAKSIKESIESTQHKEYETSANQLRDIYFSEVKTITAIYNYVGHIDISLKIYEIFNERNEMANPLAYNEFSKWVKTMNSLSDLAQQDYISDLKKEFDKQRKQYDTDIIKSKSKIGKVLNLAADVGNVLTGGKLKSIVNSFKGVFSSLFSRSNIQTRNNPLQPAKLGEIKVNGKKQDVTIYVKNEEVEKENQKLISKGREKYKNFSAFFNIIEEEYSLLDYHSNNWKDANLTMQGLIGDSKNILINYISLIDDSLANNNEFIVRILDNDKEAMGLLNSKIDKYFSEIVGNKDEFSQKKKSKQEKISQISTNVKEVDILLDRYVLASLRFKNLFESLKQTLDSRENPWKKWMDDNNIKSFEKAQEHWETKKTNLVKNLLPSIIENVDDKYVKVNLRDVPAVWKKKE